MFYEGFMYPEPGSNRHGLLHWCLRPARLPIPPSGLVCFSVACELCIPMGRLAVVRAERGTGRLFLHVWSAKVSEFSEIAK